MGFTGLFRIEIKLRAESRLTINDAIFNLQSSIFDLQSSILDPQSSILNLRSSILNPLRSAGMILSSLRLRFVDKPLRPRPQISFNLSALLRRFVALS